MKLRMIGLMVLGCALAAGAFVLAPTPAQAERQASNPAVRMAVATSLSEPIGAGLTMDTKLPDDLLSGPSFAIRRPPFRFNDANGHDRPFSDDNRDMDVEFSLSATTPNGFDVALAPRAALSVGPEGRTGAGAGAEVRIGKGLRNLVRPFQSYNNEGSWYFFAATDGSAVTWRPETAAEGVRGLRFQPERVVVGDAQIGVSAEMNGMQASLSFVNREISNGKESTDQNFVGATFTWRR